MYSFLNGEVLKNDEVRVDFFQNRRLDLDSALAAGVGSPLTLLPFYLFSGKLS